MSRKARSNNKGDFLDEDEFESAQADNAKARIEKLVKKKNDGKGRTSYSKRLRRDAATSNDTL